MYVSYYTMPEIMAFDAARRCIREHWRLRHVAYDREQLQRAFHRVHDAKIRERREHTARRAKMKQRIGADELRRLEDDGMALSGT